jgi:hypothetical protein
VKVSVDTRGRSGLLIKHVAVHTNDPVSPVAALTVTLHVVPALP